MRNANRWFVFLFGVAVLWGCCGVANAVTPMVSAGYVHSIGLSADGKVYGWGDNSGGQLGLGQITQANVPQAVPGLNLGQGAGKSRVATRYAHNLTVRSDGSVWAWGYNWAGQLGDGTTTTRTSPVQVPGLTGVVAVATGLHQSLAVKSDGSVWAWGNNSGGQLGDGTTTNRSSPVQIPGLSDVVAVATEGAHTIALKSDGSVWAWGYNGYGQLGNSTWEASFSPKQVPGLTGVVAVAAGYYHSLAVKSDGSVWAWGRNDGAELGDGTMTSRSSPVQVKGLAGVVAVATGGLISYSLAVKSDGSVWKWGERNYAYPAQVPGLGGVVSVAAGDSHSLARKSDGSVWAWGLNAHGQLGDGTTKKHSAPVPVPGLTGVVLVAAGGDHSLAVKSDGSVWAWGWNCDGGNSEITGQLGDGTTSRHSAPVPVPGLTGMVAVASGPNYTLAVKSDGSAWTWGDNWTGQLGDGTTTNRSSPVRVWGLTGVVAMAAGYDHSLAVKSDGSVWAWGDNSGGKLGDGTTTDRSSPVQVPGFTGAVSVAVGDSHALALKSDGSVWAWGSNRYGELGDGTTANHSSPVQVLGLTGVAAVAAGYSHSLALKSDGSVWEWGFVQLGDGRSSPVQVKGLTGVAALAEGRANSHFAIKLDGTVWTWSHDFSPVQWPGITSAVAVASGDYHTLALKSDGSVLAWGGWLGSELGIIGDGTFVQRPSPVLVVNPSVDGFLNLKPGTTLNVPPELQVPFFVSSSGGITATSATVSTTIKFNAADLGKSGAVFVTAMVPSGSPLALSASNMTRAKALAAPAANTFVQIQLTSTGWQQVIGGQLIPLASGVLSDLLAAQTILNGTETNLQGAQFCVGYGTSATEMIATGKMRVVATIPTDSNAASAASVSCVMAGGSVATVYVMEFYNANINHYFMTASSEEAVALDNKPSWGWARTGKTFNVVLNQASAPGNASPVCRFFGVFANGTVGSHFYTADPVECANVKSRLDWGWGYENDAFYAVQPTGSSCPSGTAPVYRVYNNGMGGAPNHRYMANQADVSTMVSQGWVSEGTGTAFCGAQ